MLIILGVAVVAILFYYVLIKPMDYWKERGVKQGNLKRYFLEHFGMLFKLQSITEMVQEAYNYSPGTRYFGSYQFGAPALLLKDPDLIKQITVKDFDHFTDHRTFVPTEADPLWTKNLFALKGEPWHDMRSILSPSFTSSKMKTMFVLISECAENFVQHFLKKDKEIITVEFKDIFTRFTTDVIATAAFGVKVDSLAEPNNEFYLMGKHVTNLFSFWNTAKLFILFYFPKISEVLQLKLFTKEVNDFFRHLITDTIKTRKEKGIVRPDMIHLLMEARKGIQKPEENGIIDTGYATVQESDLGRAKTARDLSNEDITSQAFIFFFAGFETVSTFMCFAAYELAVNPNIQDRLRQEVQDTTEECGGKLTYESLLRMKYMDMVVSEVMRLWPNVVALDRVCTKPYTIEPVTPEEKAVHLEKGALLSLPIFGIHRDPQNYPNPERFDPERFSDENKANIKPYTYLPFGVGPRNCIGSRFALMEVKCVFFYILQYFELVPVDKSRIPLKISRKSFNLTAEGGFWFGLKRIKK